MRKITLAIPVVLGALCVLGATPCLAQQQTADDAFKSVYGPPTPDQQQVNLNIATTELQAARGGFGPATSNTTIGTVNEVNNYNGPVTNSGSSNSVNSSSVSSTITASDATVILTPSVSQQSTSANQQAASTVTTNSNNH